MAFFDQIARGFHTVRAGGDALAEDDGEGSFGGRYFSGLFGNAYSTTGMRITPESVKAIGCAQACVSIIGRNIAQMPLKVIEETRHGKRLATENPEYHVLYSRPNDRQTAFEFRQMMQGHFELWGNAYAEKVMDRRGVTLQLLPMHPARVTPEVLSSGRMRYKYADPLTSTTRTLVQEQVFHLRNWSDDGYIGQSTVSMGKDVFGVALAAQDYAANLFKNDGRPSAYFQQKDQTAQRFKSKEEAEEFRENWRKQQTGANRHKIGLLPLGWEIKELGNSPAEAQLLEARKFSRIEICSLFGVPPHLVGETEKAATYASVEQFNIMFATQCILPRVVVWEQAIQRDLLQDESLQAKFSMAALLRGDNASRTASYAVAIQNGWMSQNDVRLLEDLDPIPDGNTYWRPLAWAPLGQLTNPETDGGGDGPGKKSKEQEQPESEERTTKKAAIVHNTHVLAALADKTPAEAAAALAVIAAVRSIDE